MNITYTTTSCVCREDLFNHWHYPATQIGGFVSSTNSNPGVSGQDSLTPSTIYTATFGFGGFYDNGNSQCTYGNNPTALLYGSGKQRSGVCDASASQRWIDSSDDTGATIDSLNWNVGTANTGSAMIHFAVSLNAPIGNFPPLHVFTTFNGINEGCIYCIDPPDVQLAFGPSQIIELVNLAYQVYNKGGTAITSPASASILQNQFPNFRRSQGAVRLALWKILCILDGQQRQLPRNRSLRYEQRNWNMAFLQDKRGLPTRTRLQR